MSGLQCHVNTGMASGADGCVHDLWDHVCANSESTATGPRTLCNACGLVYAKMVRIINDLLLLLLTRPSSRSRKGLKIKAQTLKNPPPLVAVATKLAALRRRF